METDLKQCPECAERQLTEEREREGGLMNEDQEVDAANLAAERVEAILGDEASVDVTADGFVSIMVPAELAARICVEADGEDERTLLVTREQRDCVQAALESAAMPMGDAIEKPIEALLRDWDARERPRRMDYDEARYDAGLLS